MGGKAVTSIETRSEADGIALQPDGKVVIGGEFGFAADVPRHHLARLNADGTVDPSWYPEANGAVNSLALQAAASARPRGGARSTTPWSTRVRLSAAFRSC